MHTTLKARVVDSLSFVDRDELSNKLQHVLESYGVVTLAEHFFSFFSNFSIFAKVTIFLSEKAHSNSKQTIFQVFFKFSIAK